jgi:hypothetical protein
MSWLAVGEGSSEMENRAGALSKVEAMFALTDQRQSAAGRRPVVRVRVVLVSRIVDLSHRPAKNGEGKYNPRHWQAVSREQRAAHEVEKVRSQKPEFRSEKGTAGFFLLNSHSDF